MASVRAIKLRQVRGMGQPVAAQAGPPTQETDDWINNPPVSVQDQQRILEANLPFLQEATPRGKALREMARSLKSFTEEQIDKAREANPLAFLRVSWEQALKLNSWVWGISFNCDFDANRKGKTAAAIFNALLWIVPNDPQWRIFQQYVDEWERTINVLQRPTRAAAIKLQKFLEANPTAQGNPKFAINDIPSGNAAKFALLQKYVPNAFNPAWPKPPFKDRRAVIWQGAPDVDYHKQIVMPEWRKWIPKHILLRDAEHDKVMELFIQSPVGEQIWKIIFKSYESKDEKFSGAAVKAILLTEGIKQSHLNEIKQRFQEDAWASWDYTPYEPHNVGQKTAIAHRVYKGKEQLPLRPFVYSGFGISKTPSFILPESKKADLMRIWGTSAEGKARIEGNFYSSSPVVLTNLDEEKHALPWDRRYLFDKYPDGRIYRAIDPGYDHPTVCAWGYLTKINVWFIYRVFSESGLSLGQRCDRIIQLSGNERHKLQYGKGSEDYYFEEVHPNAHSEVPVLTIGDYHVFKTDEQTLQPFSNKYAREGLPLVRSVTYGPRERGQILDQALEPSLVRSHPLLQKPPGARMYFLVNETGVASAFERLENIFWDRYSTGDKKGLPKDEIQELDDDEFDAVSYLACSPFRWNHTRPRRREAQHIEMLDEKVRAFSYRPQIGFHRTSQPTFMSTGY